MMGNLITELDKAFDSRVRLGIMSILSVNESVDFNTMKLLLELTDGNLASHLKSLEVLDYVEMEKQFIGRKPNTKYRITKKGRESFNKHLNALEKLINSTNQ